MNKKFSKLMLTSASALALLAAYPSIASTSEAVGVELPSITAEAATQGNAFIRVVRALPSAKNIKTSDATRVRAARNLYNSLPAAEKANAGVVRWAEYLAEKEAALPVDHVANFIAESRALPNVREINAMDASEFAQAKVDLQAARSSYAKLTSSQKADADVARWAGYLTVKEDAFGVTFILEAKALPSVRRINEMNEDQLAVLAEDIASVRELYEALSPTAKADAEVARWNRYVDDKEEAAEGEDVVVDLEEVKATKTAEIEAVVLSEEDTAGKTEESIALAEAKLEELKEAALEAVEAAETEEEVEAVELDTADALALLEDVVEDEELVVESVSAITKTAVDVELEALKEAKTGAIIEVRDNKGNLVEVKPVDLVKGETVASFTFERALTVDPEGVWTVGGVKVDLDLQKNLKSVYNYTNQIKLLEGLNKLGLSNVNADNIVQYQNAIDKLKNIADKDNYVSEENFTKAVAQKVVNDGNKVAAEVKDEKAIVKAVNEATNQVALLNALSTFERVNPEWIAAYDAAIGTTEASIKGIQTKIDNVNKSNVDTKVNALNLDVANASVVKKDLDEAKALVSAYQKPDGKGETAKAETLRKIERQLAVRNVLDATTPAQLTVSINGLKAVDAAFEFSMDNFKDANRQAYLDAIKANPGNFNTISKINSEFITVNNTQAATPIANVKAKGNFAVAAPTATQKAELLAALKAADLKHVSDSNIDAYATLADTTSTSKNAFGEITISGTLANDKAIVQALVEKANLAAIQAATTADDVYTALVAYGNDVKDLSVNNKAQYLTDKANYITDKTTIQAAVNASNIKELQKQTTAAGVLAKLNIMGQLKNVKAENAAAYLASVKDTSTSGALGTTAVTTVAAVQTEIDKINTAEAAVKGVKAVNEATTATQMRDILTDLVVDGDITAASYLNLTNADKLLVAELFLNDDVFTSTGLAGAVRTSVDANGDYTALGNIGTDVAKLATAFDKLRTDTNTVFSGKNVGTVTIGSVQAELDKLVKANYTAYDKLTGTQKLAVAEKFIASFPVDKDGAKYLSGYTTMGAYTAAVDAAIAAAK